MDIYFAKYKDERFVDYIEIKDYRGNFPSSLRRLAGKEVNNEQHRLKIIDHKS